MGQEALKKKRVTNSLDPVVFVIHIVKNEQYSLGCLRRVVTHLFKNEQYSLGHF